MANRQNRASADEADDEVVILGERTLEERNREGFANAIDLDLFADDSTAQGPPPAVVSNPAAAATVPATASLAHRTTEREVASPMGLPDRLYYAIDSLRATFSPPLDDQRVAKVTGMILEAHGYPSHGRALEAIATDPCAEVIICLSTLREAEAVERWQIEHGAASLSQHAALGAQLPKAEERDSGAMCDERVQHQALRRSAEQYLDRLLMTHFACAVLAFDRAKGPTLAAWRRRPLPQVRRPARCVSSPSPSEAEAPPPVARRVCAGASLSARMAMTCPQTRPRCHASSTHATKQA